MAAARGRGKDALMERTLTLVRKLAKGSGPKAAATFAAGFYEHVSADDIVECTPEELAAAAVSLWRFGARRKPGKPLVRAFNPRRDKDGWQPAHTIIEIVNDDMPFLVDSVTNAVVGLGFNVHLVIHPIVRLHRDKSGAIRKLLDAENGDPTAQAESFMHVEIDEQSDRERLRRLEEALHRVLADVRASVEDWPRMRSQVAGILADLDATPPPLPPDELDEGKQFLRWLDEGHFTFLGYREYTFPHRRRKTRLDVVEGSGLGILRSDDARVFEGVRNLTTLPPEVDEFVQQPKLLLIAKANRRSTVHRAGHLDAIGVKEFDEAGRVTGERLFVGLFTSAAYNRSPRYIPLLRRKIDSTIEAAGLHPSSHDGKALLNILETFPRDELFQIGGPELLDISTGILHLQDRHRTALFVRRDPFERFVSCLVYSPRDKYDTQLRHRFQRILEGAFEGKCTSFDTQLDQNSVLARLHFMIQTEPGRVPAIDVRDLEARLVRAARSWGDQLHQQLVAALGEEAGLQRLDRYRDAFGAAYQESFGAAVAVEDIGVMERVFEHGTLGMNLHRREEQPEQEVRFKIYNLENPVPLSDVLPILENLGFKVISEQPFRVNPRDRDAIWIHDFGLIRRDAGTVDLAAVRESFHDAFAQVWQSRMEDDGFNKLVIGAGLTWRQIVVLRAYAKYLRQAQIPFSQDYMQETLARNTDLARHIVHLFEARFDPANGDAAEKKANGVRGAISRALDAVSNLDEDRIIRRFVNLVEATLRTSFYQPGPDGKPKTYVSFKLSSRDIDELPAPRPMAEIFVYSPWVEGVHLRFGKVARGGLRWSDRREDFRTEVLGLVKAQQVKNAVIVPVGSKGGFVVKRPPAEGDREALLAEGIACYRTFISGLLDLTDNLKGAKVVPPRDVVRKDDDDPYLVVAADKGTATFSDIANGVAREYGFWLDDAFASGGSAGYDHKKMGITARGAWESVKRHFREIGRDIQREDFTVVGVGDMSGDVFGNGMLLSRHIRLVAAFNHLHIFVDPDPDPEKSWKERKRLFDLPRSTWLDYNSKLLSKGGAIFDRKSKSLKLTPEIQARFGIAKESVTPNELIRVLLTSEVDLLWFGGIGTYVKSREENHLEVGDRANDSLRVDGRELRAQVVGEGANLGVTQLGRIEYALRGGRINTDAVDNSAGVDCSDHEVNIKILLGAAERAKKLTRPRRDKLLEKMTDDVAELVLRDNYLQTACLSVTQHVGARLTDRFGHFMHALERRGALDRALEFLPDDEALTDRRRDKVGLTRPELSVLLAYAKIVLYDELLASDFPDDRFMVTDLERYFPAALGRKFAKEIAGHRLRREIIATHATNSIINRAGILFVHEVKDRTGAQACDVARGYTISRAVFDVRDLWAEIEALDNKAPAEVQHEMVMEIGRLLQRSTIWFLRSEPQPLDIAAQIETYGTGVRELSRVLDKVLPDSDHAFVDQIATRLVEKGAPEKLARRIADLRVLVPAGDIVKLSAQRKVSVEQAARLYFAVGDRLALGWLRRGAASLPAESHWDKQATAAIIDDLYGHQYELAGRILADADGAADPLAAIGRWSESRGVAFGAASELVDQIRARGTIDLAMLAVANRQLRTLTAT